MPISDRPDRKTISLCGRLTAAADLVSDGCRIADIGTDHALLAASLLLRDRISFAVLSDIVVGPLQRAQRTIDRYRLQERTALRLSDGFAALSPDEFDEAVLCGMGGLTIIGILQRAPWLVAAGKRLILQPQTDAAALRAWLSDCGWQLDFGRETAVTENGHCYTVFSARPVDPARPVRPAEDYRFFLAEWADRPEVWRGQLRADRLADRQYLQHFSREIDGLLIGAQHAGETARATALQRLQREIEAFSATEEAT